MYDGNGLYIGAPYDFVYRTQRQWAKRGKELGLPEMQEQYERGPRCEAERHYWPAHYTGGVEVTCDSCGHTKVEERRWFHPPVGNRCERHARWVIDADGKSHKVCTTHAARLMHTAVLITK